MTTFLGKSAVGTILLLIRSWIVITSVSRPAHNDHRPPTTDPTATTRFPSISVVAYAEGESSKGSRVEEQDPVGGFNTDLQAVGSNARSHFIP